MHPGVDSALQPSGEAVVVDAGGNAYVTGVTVYPHYPFTTPPPPNLVTVPFISKLDPTGSYLVYSTYLGGSGNDQGNGIALDGAGDAYVVGQTFSSDFPTTPGVFQSSCGGTCRSSANVLRQCCRFASHRQSERQFPVLPFNR